MIDKYITLFWWWVKGPLQTATELAVLVGFFSGLLRVLHGLFV